MKTENNINTYQWICNIHIFNTSPHRVSPKKKYYLLLLLKIMISLIICPIPPNSTSSLLITHFTFHHTLYSSVDTNHSFY